MGASFAALLAARAWHACVPARRTAAVIFIPEISRFRLSALGHTVIACPNIQMNLYLLTYQRAGRLANLVIVSPESLTEARLRCAPGVGDTVLDQVLPLDPEIAADLPADLIGKVLTSQAAMRVLHHVARQAKQVK
jgi:hypothetical protein